MKTKEQELLEEILEELRVLNSAISSVIENQNLYMMKMIREQGGLS